MTKRLILHFQILVKPCEGLTSQNMIFFCTGRRYESIPSTSIYAYYIMKAHYDIVSYPKQTIKNSEELATGARIFKVTPAIGLLSVEISQWLMAKSMEIDANMNGPSCSEVLMSTLTEIFSRRNMTNHVVS